MWYATHCVSPCLAILSDPAKSKLAHAESVVCHGSGRIREELIKKYNSPFAIETATFKIRDSDVVAEVTRSALRHGPAISRELRRDGDERQLRVAAGAKARNRCCTCAACRSRRSRGGSRCRISRAGLPEAIRKFTGAIHDATHLSFLQGGGHGGSHPHLAHNFLMAVLGRQPAFPDAADQRQLDDGRHLRPRVGDEGRRTGGYPAF